VGQLAALQHLVEDRGPLGGFADTVLFFAQMQDGQVVLNHGENEFDLFTKPLAQSACGSWKDSAYLGGCPAEEVVMGASSCAQYRDIVPVCRLWKSSAKPE
jgi:hypothetical protein